MSTSELNPGPSSWRLGIGARFFVYGLIGLCVEFLFTSLMDLASGAGDLRLRGYSYIWMHPIWGAGILLCEHLGLIMRRKGVSLWARGVIYMVLCFTVEYVAGALLLATIGRCPWDYTGATWSVHGLIRLDYAPFWALSGCVGEYVCALVRRVRIHAGDPGMMPLPIPLPVPPRVAVAPPRSVSALGGTPRP